MSFDLTNSQHKNVAQTLGLYFGGFITAAFVAGGLYTDGYKYACAFAVGGVFYFLVTLVMYAVTIPELLNLANGQTAPQSPENEPDEEIDDDEETHPPQPQRPLQPPIRERQAQFVTVDSGARIVDGWMRFGNRNVPLPTHIKPEWLTAVRKAQLSHISGNLLHQAGVSRFEQADSEGNTPANLTIDFLRERGLIERDGQVWRFTEDGRKAFPSPTHIMH